MKSVLEGILYKVFWLALQIVQIKKLKIVNAEKKEGV
jgi:hypothetical protein